MRCTRATLGAGSALDRLADKGIDALKGVSVDHASLSLSLPTRPEALPFVREMLGCFAVVLGADDEPVEAMKLAVHEAAANVLEHAYADERGDGVLRVKVRSERGTVTVLVSDTTTTVIAGSNRDAPPLREQTAEAGRGLPIIEALADDVEVRRSAGTHAEMIFTLDLAEPDFRRLFEPAPRA